MLVLTVPGNALGTAVKVAKAFSWKMRSKREQAKIVPSEFSIAIGLLRKLSGLTKPSWISVQKCLARRVVLAKLRRPHF